MKSEDILKRAQELISSKSLEKQAEKSQLEADRVNLIASIGSDIASALRPVLEDMAQAQQVTVDSIRQMLKEIKIDVPQTEVRMPTINVPRPQVNVTVPEMKMPQMNIPAPVVNFPDRMAVTMDTVSGESPLPVMMMDAKGKPMTFSFGPGVGGGGKADFLNIKDIKTSTGASWFNDEGLRVSGSFSVTASNSSTQAIDSSGEAYSQANPFPVIDMSGSLGSTASALIDSSGVQYSGSNPLPVTITSGGTATSASNIVDSTGIAYTGSNPVPMRIVTDATATVNVVNVDSAGAYRSTFPVSGTVAVSGVSGTSAVNLSDSSGIGYSGSNPLPFTLVTNATATMNVAVTDSSGIQYSGSNPIPVTMVSGANDTIASLPFEVMTTNRTSKSDGADIRPKADKQGRQMTRISARDLVQTAYASLTNGTETTLLSATAGFFYDLIYVMGANNSDAAVTVDIRPVTAGNVVMTLQVPANGTAGVSLPLPLPQSGSDTGNNWTADMGDITGTTVYLSALFSKEV